MYSFVPDPSNGEGKKQLSVRGRISVKIEQCQWENTVTRFGSDLQQEQSFFFIDYFESFSKEFSWDFRKTQQKGIIYSLISGYGTFSF